MALKKIYQFICINDTAGAYDNGDSIIVYWNDSDLEINVYLNDVEVFSGGDILTTELNYPTAYYYLNNQSFQTCDGSTLISFERKQAFPYAQKILESNSPLCPVEGGGSTTCNISFSIINKTNADEGMNNGEITAVVFSTNAPCKIKIGDFDPFTDGLDMTQNGAYHTYTFSGLAPGYYTLYAYDANNCKAISQEVIVGIKYSDTYANIFTFTFNDLEGKSALLEIQQRGYAGSATDLSYAGEIPVMHMLNGSEQRLESPVLPSELEVNLVNQVDGLYMSTFRDSDERRFFARYYMNYGSGNELHFQGFLTQELLSEPFESVPYLSRVRFTDRLSDLSNFPFAISTGDVTLLEVFVHCLDNLGLPNGYRIFDNLYEITQDSAATDDPWTQTYVDAKSFYTENEPDDCLTVIQKILTPRRAQIFSWGGYWYIMRIGERHTSIDYREFDVTGTYVTNGTLNPIVDIKAGRDTSRLVPIEGSNNLRLEEIFKFINVRENRKIRESIAAPFTEENITPDGKSFIGWNPFMGQEAGSWTVEKIGAVIPESAFITGGGGVSRGRGGAVGDRGGSPPRRGGFTVLPTGSRTSFRTFETEDFQDRYVFVANFDEEQAANPGSSVTGATNVFNGAFISNIGSIEYNRNDRIEISFDYFFQMNTTWIPYVALKWYFRLGTKYLQADGTWSDTAVTNDYFIEDYNVGGSFSIVANFDESFTSNQTDTYEFRAYNIDSLYTDVVAQNDNNLAAYIRTLSTTGLVTGHRLSAKRIDVSDTTKYYIYLYELRSSTAAESGSSIIKPDDNSLYRWVQVFVSSEITENSVPYFAQSTIRYATAVIRTYPNSEALAEVAVERATLSQFFNQKELDYDLFLFDADTAVNNFEKQVINYFKLSDGSPCTHWGPATFLNDNRIQKQLAEELRQQYSISKYRVSGRGRSDIRVAFFNVFRHVSDQNRTYLPVSMAIDYRNNEISNLDMIEIKSDDQVLVAEHTTDEHTNEFS